MKPKKLQMNKLLFKYIEKNKNVLFFWNSI